jgi:diguanylate cyclase (GGDEF)-like protein
MDQALPKSNRVAAQALKQGLPIVVADTSARLEDVGPLVAQTGIRSFALIPIPGRSAVEGLAYINFDQVERAGSVFDPDVSKAIEVVLNSAAATFAALIDKSGDELEDAIDDTTDSYTLKQFTRLLSAEMERARRYRFSVSVLALDIDTGTGPEMRLPDDTARAVVAAMSTCARASDIVGHGRNNFFALMLPQTTSKGAALVARRVEDAVSAVLWTPGAAATSVRVGVATFPDSGTDAASLIEAARMPAVTNPAPTRPDGFHVSSVRKGDS